MGELRRHCRRFRDGAASRSAFHWALDATHPFAVIEEEIELPAIFDCGEIDLIEWGTRSVRVKLATEALNLNRLAEPAINLQSPLPTFGIVVAQVTPLRVSTIRAIDTR